ncbi:MAG: branched-chain amino acid ABC transporter permease, partial [Desulfobacterales bacterium]|nr:branched-chain amino acid ABC transporter permease [Desulfobacterales bacterium]
MEAASSALSAPKSGLNNKIRQLYSRVPVLGWLCGALAAVLLEQIVGRLLAVGLGLSKIPALFGFTIILKYPALFPSALLYVFLIYLLPIVIVARLSLAPTNWLAEKMMDYSMQGSVLVHLVLLYAIFHIWAGMSDYREITLKFTLIAIMITVSLNVVNGYMGEFSCSHPGFMALGAYTASVFTVSLFVNDSQFGPALLPACLGPFVFPL